MLTACLNGPRTRLEHPGLPLTADELAADAVLCVQAGADAVHLHPRAEDGRESLDPAVVDPVVEHVAAACGVPVGVSTGAWIEPDPARRVEFVAGWSAPAFASVNLSEDGAAAVIRALLDAGIGVEAGVWTVQEADALAATGLSRSLVRVLVEPMDRDGAVAAARAAAIEARFDALGLTTPRLHHGEGLATWAVLRQAAGQGLDVRVGLEDTRVLPDGSTAAGNEELVVAARSLVASSASHK